MCLLFLGAGPCVGDLDQAPDAHMPGRAQCVSPGRSHHSKVLFRSYPPRGRLVRALPSHFFCSAAPAATTAAAAAACSAAAAASVAAAAAAASVAAAAAAASVAAAAASAAARALAIASTSVLTLATCASTSALLRPIGAAREGASDTGSSSCPCSTFLPSPSSCRGLPVATRWRLTVGEKACAARVAAYGPCHHSDSLSRFAFGSSETCVGLLAGVAPGVDVRGAGLVLGDLHMPSYELFG
mmetsp:Transcript_32474/g.75124  ORF Transcript_32474/g.75124 Transcript_32474/m.75124 type:complete len:242 (-) Transcript_32474:220-945(-)